MFEGSDSGSVSLLDLLSCMLGGAAILFVTFVAISTRLERGNSGPPVRPQAMTDLVKIVIPHSPHLGAVSFDPEPALQSLQEAKGPDAINWRGPVPPVTIYELAFNSGATKVSINGSGCKGVDELNAVFDRAAVTWFHHGKEYETSRDASSCSPEDGRWTTSFRRETNQIAVSLDDMCPIDWFGKSRLVAERVDASGHYMILAVHGATSAIEGCRLAGFVNAFASAQNEIANLWLGIDSFIFPRVDGGGPRAVLTPRVDVQLEASPPDPMLLQMLPPGMQHPPIARAPSGSPQGANGTMDVHYKVELSREQSAQKLIGGYFGPRDFTSRPGDASGSVTNPPLDNKALTYMESHARRSVEGDFSLRSVGSATCGFRDDASWPIICYVAATIQNPAR